MPKAMWEGVVLAETDEYETVEGNIYFPEESIKREYFSESDTHSHCPWKGDASYYHITVNDAVNRDAAWFYPQAMDKAKHIEGKVAFWKGVEVSE